MLSDRSAVEDPRERIVDQQESLAGPSMSDSSPVEDHHEQIIYQQQPQAGPSTSSIVRSSETKNAAPVKVGASSTPDIVASRELAVRMRRLKLDQLQFETEIKSLNSRSVSSKSPGNLLYRMRAHRTRRRRQ